jgi:hypothetical protein
VVENCVNEKNTFIDNAPEGGTVIDIQSGTESITIRDNTFTETRGGQKRELVKKKPRYEANRRRGQSGTLNTPSVPR